MPENARFAGFSQLLLECLSLWSWQYDDTFRLIAGNCPEAKVYEQYFATQQELVCILREQGLLPAIVQAKDGMAWAVTTDGEHYYVLGPVQLAVFDKREDAEPDLTDTLPLFSIQELSRYATMLHSTLTGTPKAVHMPGGAHGMARPSASVLLLARLQDKVRNGDYKYKELVLEVLTDRQSLYELGAISQNSAKQVAGLSMALCRQAALEGGLTAQTIDALYDEHLPQIQAAKYACEIALRCDMLLYHLIRLVRRAKGDTAVSDPIQACCTFIAEHVDEKLTMSTLARQVGYSPDHLSKRFRAEIGQSIKEYILQMKIHRAQLMLTTTRLPIGDIAQLLSFSSSSHFGKIFHALVQQTPAAYRAKHSHAV